MSSIASKLIGNPAIVKTKGAPRKVRKGQKRRRCAHCKSRKHFIKRCPLLPNKPLGHSHLTAALLLPAHHYGTIAARPCIAPPRPSVKSVVPLPLTTPSLCDSASASHGPVPASCRRCHHLEVVKVLRSSLCSLCFLVFFLRIDEDSQDASMSSDSAAPSSSIEMSDSDSIVFEDPMS
ncbi:hypothetical protein PIB30_069452 [Stylosanthes scabra]|uniref:Uncharacterized protein n=1 Tax=Stylosanthes scabra TaxID=79078 RepID=A0ABU6QNK9_9FABA|nr:hypothetical protein [Stylosanthes scabra]